MKRVSIAMLAVVACGGVGGAATPHVDDFSIDEMGWSGGTSPQWQPSGGPLGIGDGFLSVPNSTHLATHNTTAAWTGDYTAIDAESISVDMMNEPGSQILHMRLVLFGAGATPQSANRWTSTVAAIVPADGEWRNYTLSLAASDLTRVLGLGSYQDTITNVVQVMLRHDTNPPSSGGDFVSATLGIDNVRLAAAPLPGDYNRDGEVDLGDYHTWRGMFGATGSAADGNSNGVVDAADYTVWRDHATLSAAEAHAVPEADIWPVATIAASGWLAAMRCRCPGRAGS